MIKGLLIFILILFIVPTFYSTNSSGKRYDATDISEAHLIQDSTYDTKILSNNYHIIVKAFLEEKVEKPKLSGLGISLFRSMIATSIYLA
ncbi:hypothetical protein [Pseudoalteromonas 'SMAR']|uniref:hypothetical protein n=1 Tax=Pseudoalteromonas 'SMAR' TaxID=3416908 RepID=UPI003AF2F4A2